MESTNKKSLESFYEDITHYRTEAVCEALKANIMDDVDADDRNGVLRKLVALRGKQVISILDKKMDTFPVAMLQVDLDNQNNREFIYYILDKYRKKFDKSKASVCEMLFDTACKVNHKNTILYLISNKKAVCKYPELAKGSEEMFKLIDKIPSELRDKDLTVQLFANAALADDNISRLKALKKKGYDPKAKNSKGQTACDVLEEYIKTFLYPKNKHGEIMKKEHLSSLKNLQRFTERGDISDALSTEDIYELSDSEVDYNTDTSLVVEDGDTVNIDYTGYVDGVAFEGGSTDGYGTSLTIGSGTYIDDFEEQLIGHNVGEEVEVNVTFPENYGNEELNGKDAVFDVVINGIYE